MAEDEPDTIEPQDDDLKCVTLSPSDVVPLRPRARDQPSNEIRTYFQGVYPFYPYLQQLERPEVFEQFTQYLRARAHTDLNDFNTIFERSRQFLTEAKSEMQNVTKVVTMELQSAFNASRVLRTDRAQAALLLVPQAVKVITRRIDQWLTALEYMRTEMHPHFHHWVVGLSLAATSLGTAASAVKHYRDSEDVTRHRIFTSFVENLEPLLERAATVQELLSILDGESRLQCRSMQKTIMRARRIIEAARQTSMVAFDGAAFSQRYQVIAALQKAMDLTKLETIMEPHNVALSGTALLNELITSLYSE